MLTTLACAPLRLLVYGILINPGLGIRAEKGAVLMQDDVIDQFWKYSVQ